MTEKNNIYIEDVVDVKELQTLQDNWAKATDLATVTEHRLQSRVILHLFVKGFVSWMHFVKSVTIVMPVEDGKQEGLAKHMYIYAMQD